jgi:hypothetical protein
VIGNEVTPKKVVLNLLLLGVPTTAPSTPKQQTRKAD